MADCKPRIFEGISPSVMDCARGKLAGLGLSMTSDSGELEGPMGIRVSYQYKKEEQLLEITVMDKSFFMSCDQLYGQLEKSLKQCGMP